jgi:uncharacterized protein (DUF924 family)
MRYLITTKDNEPCLTEWFDPENNFDAEIGMIVYELHKEIYTTDGVNWKNNEIDHL